MLTRNRRRRMLVTIPARLRLGAADHQHKTSVLNIRREGQTNANFRRAHEPQNIQ